MNDFKAGDKVRLIDKFWERPEFTAEPRVVRASIASDRDTVMTIYTIGRGSADMSYCKHNGTSRIPLALLELVEEPKKEQPKPIETPYGERFHSNCKHHKCSLDDEPCNSCFQHDYKLWEPAEPIDTMHHWTDAEIREAKELSYQMILDANRLICFGFYSDKTKAYAQYESASSEPSNLDAYNRDIGVCVALCKLLGKPIPAFIKGDAHV